MMSAAARQRQWPWQSGVGKFLSAETRSPAMRHGLYRIRARLELVYTGTSLQQLGSPGQARQGQHPAFVLCALRLRFAPSQQSAPSRPSSLRQPYAAWRRSAARPPHRKRCASRSSAAPSTRRRSITCAAAHSPSLAACRVSCMRLFTSTTTLDLQSHVQHLVPAALVPGKTKTKRREATCHSRSRRHIYRDT